MKKTFHRKVLHGQKLGRKIGFPTLNLRVGHFDEHIGHGVYICEVSLGKKVYNGLLHFGSKLNSPRPVLEIWLRDFSGNAYGKWVAFTVGTKIREVRAFQNLGDLKTQLQKDCRHL